MELHKKYKTLLSRYGINTPLRLAHFFAQLEHESRLQPISENLSYSSARLLQVFPKYFNKSNVSAYWGRPILVANRIYANRMGNGPEASGDGWKYRGRGFIQITGKNNYAALSAAQGIDYVNNPDWLLREPDAMIAAIWYWTRMGGNKLADQDNVSAITKAINGGYNGFADRNAKLAKWKTKLNA